MQNQMNSTHKLNFIDGIKDGLPISLGYFPIAMAFGILAKGAGLTFYEAISFSFIVFAGASQFIAVSMIAMGASGWEIVLTTFFVNLRHLLMSASLSPKIHFSKQVMKPIISFFVTDETFSVASFAKGEITERYMLMMQLLAYFGWVFGSGVGFLVGSLLPPLLQQSMEIGLYAMFVALLVPEMKKTSKAIVLGLLSGLINTFLCQIIGLAQGWSIVLSIIFVSSLGVIIYQTEYEENENNEDELVNLKKVSSDFKERLGVLENE